MVNSTVHVESFLVEEHILGETCIARIAREMKLKQLR